MKRTARCIASATWLVDPRSEITLKHARSCPAWILANDGETGYYRVDYKGKLLNEVLAEDGKHLTAAERVGVLGDVSALVGSGQMSPKLALSLVPEFSRDPEHQVVDSALSIAMLVKSRSIPDDLQPKGSAYIREVFGKRALDLGWTPQSGEDENTKLLRQGLVPDVASEGQQKELIAKAQELAKAWLSDHGAIAPELVSAVLRVAAEFGDRELFDQFEAAAKKEQDPRIRENLIRAMGSFRNPAIVEASLGLLLKGEFDFRESFYALLFGPLAYPETRDLPFRFVKGNLDALLAKLPREVGGDFAAQLPETGQAFCDEEHRGRSAVVLPGQDQGLHGRPAQSGQDDRVDRPVYRPEEGAWSGAIAVPAGARRIARYRRFRRLRPAGRLGRWRSVMPPRA